MPSPPKILILCRREDMKNYALRWATELGFEEEQAVTGLEVDGVAELPWTLAPGEEATVTLRYAPQEVAAASGVRLRLRSNHFYRAATASSTGPWVYYSAVESGSCE